MLPAEIPGGSIAEQSYFSIRKRIVVFLQTLLFLLNYLDSIRLWPLKIQNGFQPDNQSVDLFALAGINLKFVEEGVEKWNHQVDQRHHEGDQEGFCFLERSPVGFVCCCLHTKKTKQPTDVRYCSTCT